MAQTKFLLDESALPGHWYNVRADMPNPMLPILHPGTGAAGRAGRSGAALPDGADPPGGQRRARDRDSGGGARHLSHLAPDAALPRAPPGAGGRDAVAHLLQVRGHQPGRQPQAEHGRGAGLLQQARGPQAPLHRDRRGPVGQRARVRLQAARPRVQGLHGSRLVRPEAVPALDDPDVGRDDRRQPVGGDERRPHDPRRASRLDRQPRHRDLGGGRGRRRARGHGLLARQRAQPRAAAPDRDRPGGDRADGARGRVSRTSSSAASAAARTSPGSRSRSCARRSPGGRSTSSPASRPPARR